MTNGHYICLVKRKIHKEDIIEAGLNLMYLNGYNSTGIKEITEKINIPKGSFYNHFKNKEEFGLEVLNHYSEMGKEVLTEKLINNELSPLNRLKVFYKGIIKAQQDIVKCKLGCLMGNFSQELGDTNKNFRVAINEDFEESVAIFCSCLEEAQKLGEIDNSWDVNLLGRNMTNNWQGALLRMKSSGTTQPLEDFYTSTFSKMG